MKKMIFLTTLLFSTILFAQNGEPVKMGAENTSLYFPLLQGKRVAVMSNQTGMVGNEHLVDMLLKNDIRIAGIFSPEHGFRGTADAGEHVSSSIDEKTGIPIWSLYGSGSGKPSADKMKQFDVLVFDLQDVGLRFYTYYASMARLMDACAEHGKKMIVLDRPNPNGFYVDGPILDMKYKSGVGWLPIPVVHGMTLGELALMINGEKWLPEGRTCDVTVVPCENYTHQTRYDLPVAPSPNLPNNHSIYLYPSTCLFEGTVVSLGRGTPYPFEIYGHPKYKGSDFSFTPRSVPGAKNPPLLNETCYGVDLRPVSDEVIWEKRFDLSYVIDAYANLQMGEKFFTAFFEKLVGVEYIRQDIIAGKSADEIKKKWQNDVERFKQQRKPYLLYEE
ncbi:exo-beta-N-acetylmuramidase NamZ domain-containing protein [Limibacterium fermenti]|uniref:exo-beta-N-acetylmuramidase NamZ family protein n=1 Tax=Limibacterium fermenti TaxID=3229863 RepID=UPI003A644FE4